jgi:adenylylsulfate kinase-like enzyme
VEIYVRAPLEVLQERDPKGLYSREAMGQLSLPGSESTYEPPDRPDLDLDTTSMSVADAVDLVIERLGSVVKPPGRSPD